MSRNIYKTAAQVTVFSTIEKALSFFYRIYLSRTIGAEGLGIYQICLSVFAVFLTVSSSGIPITVSRLITKHNAANNVNGAHSTVSAGVFCALTLAIPIFLILFFGNKAFGFLFSDESYMQVFLILLPGLALSSVYAVLRGAFWGKKQFMPYSLIELAEDSVMVFLGCVFVWFAKDALTGAKFAAYAVLISYVFSFIVSILWYKLKGGKFLSPKPELKSVFSSALPITAMRTSSSLLNSVVAVLLPFLLVNFGGYTSQEATSLYGVALGMAVPILFIPSSLIGSIAVVIAPELSENFYKNRQLSLKNDIEKSLKAGILIAAIIIPFLFVLGEEIGLLLYSEALSGKIIKNCSFVLFPMCVSMISTTVLNSMNCEVKTLIIFIFGAVATLACIFALTPIIGIWSYMVGMAASFIISALCNLKLLYKKCKNIKIGNYFVKSLFACVVSIIFGLLIKNLFSTLLPSIFLIFISGIAIAIFSVALFYVLEIFSFKPLKKLFLKKKS